MQLPEETLLLVELPTTIQRALDAGFVSHHPCKSGPSDGAFAFELSMLMGYSSHTLENHFNKFIVLSNWT